ncbi:MAG: NadS family protein [Thiobacillus sp.]
MDKTLFDDLMQSLKEAKGIARGEAKASRRFEIAPIDAKAVREQIGLSQSEFARLMHVSIKTLQNWEQHRRNPTGPAAALLKIVSTAPDVALKSLHN